MTQLSRLNTLLAGAQMPPVAKADFQEAKVFWQGKNYGACWTLIRSDVVILDDAELPTSIWGVPVMAFREVPEI